MPSVQILRTKIMPPRTPQRVLVRPRLLDVLEGASNYRLTLLQAGAGFGKTTALASLAERCQPVIWYQVSEEDSDPLVFLLNLLHATRLALPGLNGLPLAALETWDGAHGPLPAGEVLDQYLNALSVGINAPTLLVMDDVHQAAQVPAIAHLLDRLVALAPADLHIILAARPPLSLPNLFRWRARGEVLSLDQATLAFTPAEIAALFAQLYNYELTQDEVETLTSATEGWAISLPLVWQSLRSGTAGSVEEALARQTPSLESLFDVLARDVLAAQPQDVQDFLHISATLRRMTVPALNALRNASDSSAMLAYLRRQELFVVELGEGEVRYHPIFRRFLRQAAEPSQRLEWHRKAAQFYQLQDDPDSMIYHLLQAGEPAAAAELMGTYGQALLNSGRLDTLATYLDSLPPLALRGRPMLLFLLGELARLRSRFQEALGWYSQAESEWRERGNLGEMVRCIRGQARVYLDTVNPSRAEELLQEALRLSDGAADRESQVRLYELLAENKLNAGKPDEAEQLRAQADALRQEGPSDSQLLYRVLLRTGRLTEARQKLEAKAEVERHTPVTTPRAHRETLFLLSLLYSFYGEAEAAYKAALEGTRRGEELASPFVTAVGYMRQGHALSLMDTPDSCEQARRQYEKTIESSRALAVPRLRVEALWGLCRVYGYQGDLNKAVQVAQEGTEIAAQAGDEWVGSLVRLALGASFALAGREEPALEWLQAALRGFRECADQFGMAAARLWLCLVWYRQKNLERLAPVLRETLAACRQNGYDPLLTRPTLAGPPDVHLLPPLLILARQQGWEATYASHLLQQQGLGELSLHPGYQLRVSTLGGFQVWRGNQEIPGGGWRREKTRHLFQLLVTFRNAPLEREQILEHLWPGQDPAAAQRSFKVALNTLYNVLEPQRPPGQESAYILRQGSIYGLRPGADLWLDVQAFEKLLDLTESEPETNEVSIARLEQALGLYRGEYLPEARYETWAAAEREQLAVQFLQAADQLCGLYLEENRPQQVLEVSQRILAADNCWERAYRYLMQAYHRLGDHGQVARTYQRCAQALAQELEVAPAPETQALVEQLTRPG